MTRQFLKGFLAVTILVAAVEASNAQNTTTAPPAADDATKQETPVKTGQATDAEKLLKQAAENAVSRQQYELKYNLIKDSELRWNVEHTATTKTHMGNVTEEMASRSQSVRRWKILNVDSIGNMTFEHSIESVEMWQKTGDENPVTYNSKSDKTPHQDYQAVSEKLNKTLATFTVSPAGKNVNRQSSYESAHFGVGEVTIPLPDKPVSVGYKWYVPNKFTAENEDGEVQQIAARVLFEVDKAVDGKVYLTFRTEILTPLTSEKVKSQLMQQMNRGIAVFDLELGMIVQKEVEWNEKVQGFEGPDSYLQYIAKLTEKLITDTPAASSANAKPLAPK